MALPNDFTDRIVEALEKGNVDGLGEMMSPDVTWGECASRDAVLGMVTALQHGGLAGKVGSIDRLGDRAVVEIDVQAGDQTFTTWQTLFLEDDLIVEVADTGSADDARSVQRAGPIEAPEGSDAIVEPVRLAPVLPVSDIAKAAEHYSALGFRIDRYDGAPYAFAHFGDLEIHLAQVDDLDPLTNTSAFYLWVNDARALFAQWRAADVGGRFHTPTDTEYGQCEGAHVDPDGNLIRFGSPI